MYVVVANSRGCRTFGRLRDLTSVVAAWVTDFGVGQFVVCLRLT